MAVTARSGSLVSLFRINIKYYNILLVCRVRHWLAAFS